MKTIRPYDKTEKKGRLTAALIMVINLLFSALFLAVDLNPLVPLIQFGLSVLLYFGYKNTRWVYAAAGIFNLCLILFYLFGGYFTVVQWNFGTVAAVIFLIIYAVFSIISSVLYFTDKPMDEYMYRRRTDY